MIRRIDIFMIAMVVLWLAGCEAPQQRTWDTLTECKQENTELSLHVQQLQNENTQLTQQLETTLELDKDVRLNSISTLQTVHIGSRTGFYDKDENGIAETLVVYLEPKDTAQDAIKAIGKVDIELWDLDDPNNSLVEMWEVIPEILHTAWGGTIFNAYYRLEFLPDNTLKQGTVYTIKMTFTDYISGKVLTDQKVIP